MTGSELHLQAVEHRRCDALREDLPPGTKVRVSNVAVRAGVLQLEPKCIQVGGGEESAPVCKSVETREHTAGKPK